MFVVLGLLDEIFFAAVYTWMLSLLAPTSRARGDTIDETEININGRGRSDEKSMQILRSYKYSIQISPPSDGAENDYRQKSMERKSSL